MVDIEVLLSINNISEKVDKLSLPLGEFVVISSLPLVTVLIIGWLRIFLGLGLANSNTRSEQRTCVALFETR